MSSTCDFTRTGASDDAEYAAELTAGVPRFVYSDPTPAVCPRTACSAVVNGVITYRDDNHLTAAFAASRWRQFAQALDLSKNLRPI
jgi:SGNH domain (fused to AT3 domains)